MSLLVSLFVLGIPGKSYIRVAEKILEKFLVKESKFMKVVINSDYGGFDLSHEAILRYIEEKGLKLHIHYNKEWDMLSFYTVPYEEYQKVHDKDLANGLYKDSNSLCWNPREIERNDPILVRVVQEMGEKANGRNAKLKIVDIPVDVQWFIEDYDGSEWVAEKHRTWS